MVAVAHDERDGDEHSYIERLSIQRSVLSAILE